LRRPKLLSLLIDPIGYNNGISLVAFLG